MSSQPWFRLYAEFASDPVVQTLSFEDQRHYIVVLCLKCAGVLDRKISPQARNRIISHALNLDREAMDSAKERLIEVDLIGKNWQPNAWKWRQFQSDSSTERVRKYRKSKKTGNVSVTQGGNAPDTDTDPDTDIAPSGAVETGVSDTAKTDTTKINGHEIQSVLSHLNDRAGTGFRWRDPNGQPTRAALMVKAILKKGYSVDDMNTVTDRKCDEWLHDAKMVQYLRPSTLFAPGKFEQYLDGL